LSVDRVFSVRGAGTVVTGTLVEGRLAVGAPLRLVGESGAHNTSVRGLHVHDNPVTEAEAPTRLAINLAGLPLESAHRGDVVTDDSSAGPTGVLDVLLRTNAAIKPGTTASLHVGTARSAARVDPIGGGATEDAPALLRLRLARPLVVVGGDRFILRGSDVE